MRRAAGERENEFSEIAITGVSHGRVGGREFRPTLSVSSFAPNVFAGDEKRNC